MQYAMLFYMPPEDFVERQGPKAQAFWAGFGAYRDALVEAKALKGGKALDEPETASTVKVRDGERLVQDGPYAETKEQLGGFALIEAANLDAALDLAARCPVVGRGGVVEVRPVVAMPPRGGQAPTLPEASHLMLIYADESEGAARAPADRQAISEPYMAYTGALFGAGVMAGGDRLEPASTATTVRLRNGKRLVQDGPYADTKEQLAGYYAFACKSDAEAIEWAAKCPGASSGAMEVRRILRAPAGSRA